MRLITFETIIGLLLSSILLPSFALNLNKWVNTIEQTGNFKSDGNIQDKDNTELQLLFVYSSTCGYCKQFAPVLKQFIKQTGIACKSMTSDGGLLDSFADAIYAPEILSKLYVKAYPTVFAINQKTGDVVLFSQGFLSLADLYKNYKAVARYGGKSII